MARLTQDQIDRLHADGYLLVEGALDPVLDLEPVEREFASILDRVAHELKAAGRIEDTHDDLPFAERLIAVASDAPGPIVPQFEIALATTSVDPHARINCGQATFDFLRSPRILDLVESLIGGEIYANPVQHTRIKLPPKVSEQAHIGNLTGTTQWHQDQGAVLPEADMTHTITVWAAITDATEEQGCLIYEERSHRSGLSIHCPVDAGNKDLAVGIPDQWIDAERMRPVPAKRGDLILHLPLTKHGSLPNVSDTIRWSFDLRYHPVGEPTGRPMFPGFVARSRSDPASELTSAEAWRDLWMAARDRLVGQEPPRPFRWNTDSAACA
jgi:phytanoyl-CoA hydroxylase